MAADKVTWFELPADNVARAGEFYRQVFGWHTPDTGMSDRSILAQSAPVGDDMHPKEKGTINGGILPRTKTFDRPHIVITVSDLDEKINQVVAAGGSVVQPRHEVDEVMAFAIIRDTEDNHVGIIQHL